MTDKITGTERIRRGTADASDSRTGLAGARWACPLLPGAQKDKRAPAKLSEPTRHNQLTRNKTQSISLGPARNKNNTEKKTQTTNPTARNSTDPNYKFRQPHVAKLVVFVLCRVFSKQITNQVPLISQNSHLFIRTTFVQSRSTLTLRNQERACI